MNRKNLISAAFFLVLLTATIVVIFQGNDMNTVVAAMQTLSPVYLVAAALTALFFTSAEGIMIWYLLGSLEGENPSFFLHQIFVCGIFLFRYHTVCNRRTADAALLHAERRA